MTILTTSLIHRTKRSLSLALLSSCCGLMLACADANVPAGRSVDIPPAASPPDRQQALNETVDSIMRIPLGSDALVPKPQSGDSIPYKIIGPYELRGETVAGALQLVLADEDIPIAFETDQGLERRITVTNLKGSIESVIKRICGLGDLYCSYEDGAIIVKDTETFVVSLPPLGEDFSYEDIGTGLEALTGVSPTIDGTTNTLIYTATQRNAKRASEYFKRLRANTALVVYETYIWEVQLDSINSAGIQWESIADLGNFNTGISLAGSISNQVGSPISIGLPTKGAVNLSTDDILQFITEQGAVKTISQPQLTVLSGSSATLRVAETINYIESLTRTIDDNNNETVSTTTGTVDTGFTLTIQSSWDNSTVYGNISIELDEFLGFETFDAGSDDTLQLPRTSERSLATQVRVRPGDSILIAGLVREIDQYETAGPGFMSPLVPTNRTVSSANTELVFLLRPRVIVYDTDEEYYERQQADQDEREERQRRADLKILTAEPPRIAHPRKPLSTAEAPKALPIAKLPKPEVAKAPVTPPAPTPTPAPAPTPAAVVVSTPTPEPAPAPALSYPMPSNEAIDLDIVYEETVTDLPMGSLNSDMLNPSLSAPLLIKENAIKSNKGEK